MLVMTEQWMIYTYNDIIITGNGGKLLGSKIPRKGRRKLEPYANFTCFYFRALLMCHGLQTGLRPRSRTQETGLEVRNSALFAGNSQITEQVRSQINRNLGV